MAKGVGNDASSPVRMSAIVRGIVRPLASGWPSLPSPVRLRTGAKTIARSSRREKRRRAPWPTARQKNAGAPAQVREPCAAWAGRPGGTREGSQQPSLALLRKAGNDKRLAGKSRRGPLLKPHELRRVVADRAGRRAPRCTHGAALVASLPPAPAPVVLSRRGRAAERARRIHLAQQCCRTMALSNAIPHKWGGR
jgi:hypothetical protein